MSRKFRAEWPESGLYGIYNSNRKPLEHWSKNRFNSSFPTALACYMLGRRIPAIYNKLVAVDGKLQVVSEEIPINEVLGAGDRPLEELDFCFETVFEPYVEYAYDHIIDPIDLVVKSTAGDWLAALEVKLSVMPNSGTADRPEAEWGCEMVVRSATTSYCALGMFDAVASEADAVRDIFEATCSNIGGWDSEFEIGAKTPSFVKCLDSFETTYIAHQRPLVMQPIWKTQGQTPKLADEALDIIVWSNFAFSRLFLDQSYVPVEKMSRPMRASAKLARCLWELSKSKRISIADIYRKMAFSKQTDKELSIAGDRWRRYFTTERVAHPRIAQKDLPLIMSPGFRERLRPERRLDETLYFQD